MVQKNNGTQEDAIDIFQEGVLCLWTNISQGKYILKDNTKISTYLFTICRNLWISRLRKNKKIVLLQLDAERIPEEESADHEHYYQRIKSLEQSFGKLDEACRKILQLFYYKKASLKEIAALTQTTVGTAKNSKYRCMQKLRALYPKQASL